MQSQTLEETKIRELIENWAQAVRSRDIEGIVAYHSEDFVMYDVTPPFQFIGIHAYRKTWEPFFGNTKEGVFQIEELHLTVGEHAAFGFTAMRCEDKNIKGEYVPLDFRLTIGLRKINGQWMIVHEHHSVPSE